MRKSEGQKGGGDAVYLHWNRATTVAEMASSGVRFGRPRGTKERGKLGKMERGLRGFYRTKNGRESLRVMAGITAAVRSPVRGNHGWRKNER